MEQEKAGYESLKAYISGKVNKHYIENGDPNEGYGWAGQSAARIKDIPSVRDLIHNIVIEAEEIKEKWNK